MNNTFLVIMMLINASIFGGSAVACFNYVSSIYSTKSRAWGLIVIALVNLAAVIMLSISICRKLP
jgi:hypothetical protein